MTTTDLSTIRDRIRALRAKAADSASTEAEANAAADLAAKLLAKHDLTEAELGQDHKPDGVIYDDAGKPETPLHPVQAGTGVSISRLTETKVFTRNRDGLIFAGMPADVEMATFLSTMIRGAADRGWMQAFCDQPMRGPSTKRLTMNEFRDGFYLGFAERISERLDELAQARADARRDGQTGATSRAIALRKADLIRHQMANDGLTLGKGRRRTIGGSDAGRTAGARAGDKLGLGRPVGGKSGGALQIGAH